MKGIAKLMCLAVVALAAAGCSRTISNEKYVDAMVSLGCANLTEGSKDGLSLLSDKGVSIDQIQKFRKNLDPKLAMKTSMEIARKVMGCHGVKME